MNGRPERRRAGEPPAGTGEEGGNVGRGRRREEQMTVHIEYEAERELPVPYEAIIRDVAGAALEYENCPYEAEINVVLTGDEEIRRVNRQFRGIDSPTDVLSFPGAEYDSPSDFSRVEEHFADCFNPETGELVLGDMMISVDRLMEQAEAYGHSPERELAFLTVHSMLHLCGYDHEEEEERLLMERRQEAILQSRGYTR